MAIAGPNGNAAAPLSGRLVGIGLICVMACIANSLARPSGRAPDTSEIPINRSLLGSD
jgi:hypothetical protein